MQQKSDHKCVIKIIIKLTRASFEPLQNRYIYNITTAICLRD